MKFQEKMDFDVTTRAQIWNEMNELVENYISGIHTARVSPILDPDEIRSFLGSFDLETGGNPLDILKRVYSGMWEHQLHTPHPQYYGLFNPATSVMSIVADTLVATFNPQLAAWSHSPFANEVERFVITAIGKRFGFRAEDIHGSFTTGGTEANFTAVLTALTHSFPEYLKKGIGGIVERPVLYTSLESHHSIIRAARMSGLGSTSVRLVPIDQEYKMDLVKLTEMIEKDRMDGHSPFMIVATAGTTNAGIIDSIENIVDIVGKEDLWLHVDAAWGGAAIFLPALQKSLKGIENADSITFDAHKWFSVPMGAGVFITRHPHILGQTFSIKTDYMPKEGAGMDFFDPYTHSVQWSRRFIGLKLFLPLATAGWEGYIQVLNHQNLMGDVLRSKLSESGFKILNKTPLPVVCFVHEDDINKEKLDHFLNKIVETLLTDGKVWISSTLLGGEMPVLRACITNYRTDETDIQKLVQYVTEARNRVLDAE